MLYISRLINNSLRQAFPKYLQRNINNKNGNIHSLCGTLGLSKDSAQAEAYSKTVIHNEMVILNSMRKRTQFAFCTQTTANRQARVLRKQMIESIRQQQGRVISVKAQGQELLFIDSDNLQSHIKMQQLRHKIRTTTTVNKKIQSNSINKTSQSNQSPSHHTQESILNPNQNQPINRFIRLNKNAISITQYNQYLSYGHFQDYKDYPLVKLTEISLRLINQYYNQKQQNLTEQGQNLTRQGQNLTEQGQNLTRQGQNLTKQKRTLINQGIQGENIEKGLDGDRKRCQHWKQLQYYIRKRMHNCPLKDYMRILYIALHSYRQIHKFNHNFIDSLIRGLKQQIPLMEENQLMQLYLILSQNQLPNRYHYQLGLRYSTKYQSDQIVKSPFYQHEMLYKLQQQIAQKIVKKYQKKYIKTQLTLKDQDLIKITWWLNSILLFQNTKFSLLKLNQMGNQKKNQFIVGLINVLLSKYQLNNDEQRASQAIKRLIQHKEQSNITNNRQSSITNNRQQNMANKKKNRVNVNGPSLILQNKCVCFNSIDQVIQFVQSLSLVREYLKIESETDRVKNSKELSLHDEIALDKNEIWLQKSNGVNRIIETIIGYGNVQEMIKRLFEDEKILNTDEHSKEDKWQQFVQTNNNTDSTDKSKKHHLQAVHNKLQLLKLLGQCKQRMKNPKVVHQWCCSLVNNYNIFLLFQQSIDLLKDNSHCQQQSSSYISQQQKLNITEYHLHILYMLYNNVYYVNHLQNKSSISAQSNRYGVQKLWQCYKDILKNKFKVNQKQPQPTTQKALLTPESILKMIYLQLSFNQIIKLQPKENKLQSNHPQEEYPGLQWIKTYSSNILENNNCVNNEGRLISFYVRQIQLPLYTYLMAILKCKLNSMPSQVQIQILNMLHTIKTRNDKAKHYLLQQNIHYQSLINTHQNPFIHANPSHFLPQKNNSLPMINNNKHSDYHDRQAALLGQYMMKCLEKEKKEWLRNEQIVKLTKFFTEIKAFNELRFSHPVTDFTVSTQFLFSIDSHNKKVNRVDSIPPKVLMFLSPQQLIKPDIIAQKVIYEAQGLEMIVIDRKQFLSMHINQRIQKLNCLLFSKNTPSPLRYLINQ